MKFEEKFPYTGFLPVTETPHTCTNYTSSVPPQILKPFDLPTQQNFISAKPYTTLDAAVSTQVPEVLQSSFVTQEPSEKNSRITELGILFPPPQAFASTGSVDLEATVDSSDVFYMSESSNESEISKVPTTLYFKSNFALRSPSTQMISGFDSRSALEKKTKLPHSESTDIIKCEVDDIRMFGTQTEKERRKMWNSPSVQIHEKCDILFKSFATQTSLTTCDSTKSLQTQTSKPKSFIESRSKDTFIHQTTAVISKSSKSLIANEDSSKLNHIGRNVRPSSITPTECKKETSSSQTMEKHAAYLGTAIRQLANIANDCVQQMFTVSTSARSGADSETSQGSSEKRLVLRARRSRSVDLKREPSSSTYITSSSQSSLASLPSRILPPGSLCSKPSPFAFTSPARSLFAPPTSSRDSSQGSASGASSTAEVVCDDLMTSVTYTGLSGRPSRRPASRRIRSPRESFDDVLLGKELRAKESLSMTALEESSSDRSVAERSLAPRPPTARRPRSLSPMPRPVGRSKRVISRSLTRNSGSIYGCANVGFGLDKATSRRIERSSQLLFRRSRQMVWRITNKSRAFRDRVRRMYFPDEVAGETTAATPALALCPSNRETESEAPAPASVETSPPPVPSPESSSQLPSPESQGESSQEETSSKLNNDPYSQQLRGHLEWLSNAWADISAKYSKKHRDSFRLKLQRNRSTPLRSPPELPTEAESSSLSSVAEDSEHSEQQSTRQEKKKEPKSPGHEDHQCALTSSTRTSTPVVSISPSVSKSSTVSKKEHTDISQVNNRFDDVFVQLLVSQMSDVNSNPPLNDVSSLENGTPLTEEQILNTKQLSELTCSNIPGMPEYNKNAVIPPQSDTNHELTPTNERSEKIIRINNECGRFKQVPRSLEKYIKEEPNEIVKTNKTQSYYETDSIAAHCEIQPLENPRGVIVDSLERDIRSSQILTPQYYLFQSLLLTDNINFLFSPSHSEQLYESIKTEPFDFLKNYANKNPELRVGKTITCTKGGIPVEIKSNQTEEHDSSVGDKEYDDHKEFTSAVCRKPITNARSPMWRRRRTRFTTSRLTRMGSTWQKRSTSAAFIDTSAPRTTGSLSLKTLPTNPDRPASPPAPHIAPSPMITTTSTSSSSSSSPSSSCSSTSSSSTSSSSTSSSSPSSSSTSSSSTSSSSTSSFSSCSSSSTSSTPTTVMSAPRMISGSAQTLNDSASLTEETVCSASAVPELEEETKLSLTSGSVLEKSNAQIQNDNTVEATHLCQTNLKPPPLKVASTTPSLPTISKHLIFPHIFQLQENNLKSAISTKMGVLGGETFRTSSCARDQQLHRKVTSSLSGTSAFPQFKSILPPSSSFIYASSSISSNYCIVKPELPSRSRSVSLSGTHRSHSPKPHRKFPSMDSCDFSFKHSLEFSNTPLNLSSHDSFLKYELSPKFEKQSLSTHQTRNASTEDLSTLSPLNSFKHVIEEYVKHCQNDSTETTDSDEFSSSQPLSCMSTHFHKTDFSSNSQFNRSHTVLSTSKSRVTFTSRHRRQLKRSDSPYPMASKSQLRASGRLSLAPMQKIIKSTSKVHIRLSPKNLVKISSAIHLMPTTSSNENKIDYHHTLQCKPFPTSFKIHPTSTERGSLSRPETPFTTDILAPDLTISSSFEKAYSLSSNEQISLSTSRELPKTPFSKFARPSRRNINALQTISVPPALSSPSDLLRSLRPRSVSASTTPSIRSIKSRSQSFDSSKSTESDGFAAFKSTQFSKSVEGPREEIYLHLSRNNEINNTSEALSSTSCENIMQNLMTNAIGSLRDLVASGVVDERRSFEPAVTQAMNVARSTLVDKPLLLDDESVQRKKTVRVRAYRPLDKFRKHRGNRAASSGLTSRRRELTDRSSLISFTSLTPSNRSTSSSESVHAGAQKESVVRSQKTHRVRESKQFTVASTRELHLPTVASNKMVFKRCPCDCVVRECTSPTKNSGEVEQIHQIERTSHERSHRSFPDKIRNTQMDNFETCSKKYIKKENINVSNDDALKPKTKITSPKDSHSNIIEWKQHFRRCSSSTPKSIHYYYTDVKSVITSDEMQNIDFTNNAPENKSDMTMESIKTQEKYAAHDNRRVDKTSRNDVQTLRQVGNRYMRYVDLPLCGERRNEIDNSITGFRTREHMHSQSYLSEYFKREQSDILLKKENSGSSADTAGQPVKTSAFPEHSAVTFSRHEPSVVILHETKKNLSSHSLLSSASYQQSSDSDSAEMENIKTKSIGFTCCKTPVQTNMSETTDSLHPIMDSSLDDVHPYDSVETSWSQQKLDILPSYLKRPVSPKNWLPPQAVPAPKISLISQERCRKFRKKTSLTGRGHKHVSNKSSVSFSEEFKSLRQDTCQQNVLKKPRAEIVGLKEPQVEINQDILVPAVEEIFQCVTDNMSSWAARSRTAEESQKDSNFGKNINSFAAFASFINSKISKLEVNKPAPELGAIQSGYKEVIDKKENHARLEAPAQEQREPAGVGGREETERDARTAGVEGMEGQSSVRVLLAPHIRGQTPFSSSSSSSRCFAPSHCSVAGETSSDDACAPTPAKEPNGLHSSEDSCTEISLRDSAEANALLHPMAVGLGDAELLCTSPAAACAPAFRGRASDPATLLRGRKSTADRIKR